MGATSVLGYARDAPLPLSLPAFLFAPTEPARLLDAFALSNARADRHVASKTRLMVTEDGKRVTSAVMDCLHYCLPGPSDAWALALYNLLLNNRRYARQGEEG